jgi:hypothetical protein
VVRSPYQAALRLYAIAADRWAEIDAAFPGVDVIRLPCDRFLNHVYRWAIERIKPDDLERWKMELNAPLPWEAGAGEGPDLWSDEDEAASWVEAAATLGG